MKCSFSKPTGLVKKKEEKPLDRVENEPFLFVFYMTVHVPYSLISLLNTTCKGYVLQGANAREITVHVFQIPWYFCR